LNDSDRLVAAARAARRHAVAPYSGFAVGAALRAANGRVYAGCNVENASYGLTVCAERVALLKALSEGERAFTMIAVVADTADPTPPCGACRQLLWEYCGDIDVILANMTSIASRHRLATLLPLPFDARLLDMDKGMDNGKGQRAKGKGRAKGKERAKKKQIQKRAKRTATRDR
jgi:cytidine deaminase